jgi:hypothetical protein
MLPISSRVNGASIESRKPCFDSAIRPAAADKAAKIAASPWGAVACGYAAERFARIVVHE